MLPDMIKTIGRKGGHQKAGNGYSIIRLLTQWNELVGPELAPHTRPLKIIHKKQKNRNTGELEQIISLKIMAEGSFGTVIAMRQAVILDRLNRLYGTDRFRHLLIEHGTVSHMHQTPKTKILKHYSLELPEIDDPVLKSRLESLGQAVMNSTQKS